VNSVMRAVAQRVAGASVSVAGEEIARIGPGLVVLLGVARGDGGAEADWMGDKLVSLRVFENAEGKFDRSVAEIGGAVLVVSQFTLYGDVRKGRRPSFTAAAGPEHADELYRRVAERIAGHGVPVRRGRFGARMQVALVNDGPVTVLIGTPNEAPGPV
jgi:D-tyrosyl-tRNA(Tyr) deacylase